MCALDSRKKQNQTNLKLFKTQKNHSLTSVFGLSVEAFVEHVPWMFFVLRFVLFFC